MLVVIIVCIGSQPAIMKPLAFLLFFGLTSAQALQVGGVNSALDLNSLLNTSFNADPNALEFDPASLGINLADLSRGGFNFQNLDFRNQDAMAQAIQALLGQLCLNNALDFNNIIGLGLNNQMDLFLQLAQLQQLQNLGFIGLGGAANLFNSGRVFGGGFNVGIFKRELANAKKMMKRSKLRRGQITRRQCEAVNAAQSNVANAPSAVNSAITITTASPSAAVAIATPAPPVASATPVASVATPAAIATPAAAAPVTATPAPAAPAAIPVAEPVAVASNIPAAVPVAAPAPGAGVAAPAGEENLADFTR